MKRGEVWWAALSAPSGSGPGYKRPVLIVQSNAFNSSRIGTVVVAVITSNVALADAPGNVRVSKSDSGLPQLSVINVSQLITLDKSTLTAKVRLLPADVLGSVDEGLKLVLALR